MANRQFLGTVDDDFEDAPNWDGGVSVPSAGDNLQISAACVLNGNDANVYGTLLMDAGITFNIQNYNFSCGIITDTGTLQIGTSAGTGLICAGLNIGAAGVLNLQQGSIISNSGNFTSLNNAAFTNSYRGDYRQTGNGNYSYELSAYNCFWYKFTLDAGVTLTLTKNSSITGVASESNIINGTIAIGTYAVDFGHLANKIFTIGANGDFTGSGQLRFYTNPGTWNNNRATAFSFTGTVRNEGSNSTDMCVPAWDFSNANVIILGPPVTAGVTRRVCAAGINCATLKCKDFTILHDANVSFTFTTAITNPNFEISGSILINQGTGTITYTKGTGIYTFIGDNANINPAGKDIEAVVINCTVGQTKTLQSNFTTTGFTGTSGNFADGGYTITIGTGGLVATSANFDFVSSTGWWKLPETCTLNVVGANVGTIRKITLAYSGKTVTNSASCFVGELIINEGTLNGSEIWVTYSTGNDKFTINSAATVTTQIALYASANRSQGALSCAGLSTLIIAFDTGYTLQMTGNWNFPNCTINYLVRTFDVNGNTLTVSVINMGQGTTAGTLICGAGTINCVTIQRRAACTVANTITANSSTWNVTSTFNLTGITWTKATETVNFTGSSNATITNASQALHFIVSAKDAGIKATHADLFTYDKFTLSSGIAELKNGVESVATDLVLSNGILRSDSAGNQADLKVTNYASASINNVSIQDIDAVNPLDAYNSNDLGNNLDITFVTTPRSEICLVKVGF